MADASLVDAVIEDPRWQADGLMETVERAARAALAATGRDPAGYVISLLACDDARIGALNAEFRGKHGATNVLSWPAGADQPEESPAFLGDLALAYDTCAREARAAGLAVHDHVAHLVVHGVLHLLGQDHRDDAEAEAMEALEANVLASMGLANPYSP